MIVSSKRWQIFHSKNLVVIGNLLSPLTALPKNAYRYYADGEKLKNILVSFPPAVYCSIFIQFCKG